MCRHISATVSGMISFFEMLYSLLPVKIFFVFCSSAIYFSTFLFITPIDVLYGFLSFFIIFCNGFHYFDLQVIGYYSQKGIVANLQAEKPPKEVTVEVQKALSS